MNTASKQQSATLNQEQLVQVLDQCKNYELNVQKYKIDKEYIKDLQLCLKDYGKLCSILPEWGEQ